MSLMCLPQRKYHSKLAVISVVMNYVDNNPSTGYVIGNHDIYPSYSVNVDGAMVYYHPQEPHGYSDASGIDTETYGSVIVNQGF